MSKKKALPAHEIGSGNIFGDLGVPDAEEHQLETALIVQLNTRPALLSTFASRYIWWRDDHPPSDDRIIAQVMNIGSYDDIRGLEAAYSPDELAAVMRCAQPGWIDARSWAFWRERLAVGGAGPIPSSPPRRSFHADAIDTLVSVEMPSGPVKMSFFGGIGFGRVDEPLQSVDGTLLVASIDDLMATKLKAILDRAESRDYRDIAAMLRHGASLERGLGTFMALFKGEPATVLRALGWFQDGDLPSLDQADRDILIAARAHVRDVPQVPVVSGTLAVPSGDCDGAAMVVLLAGGDKRTQDRDIAVARDLASRL